MDEESKMRLMESIGKDLGFVDDEYKLDSEEHFIAVIFRSDSSIESTWF